ncbi:MAG: hypothetical protein WA964_12800 [Ilumatobacter sp.]|uniref:hypothetical protein n=1 Tax=Ilumatobacter sp. TaxID=1967498 RepID=UPI003C77510D
MHSGYEPSRITNLTQRSRWAVGALDGIHSSDPAAVDAMAAVAGLKSVIADGLIPAATTVGIMDPLGDTSRAAGRGLWAALDDWMNRAFPSEPTRFADWSDDDLFETMTEQLDWFTDLNIDEQPDHFFWSEDLPELAEEFRRRAATDPDFARRMIDEAGNDPMIGLIVAEGGFSNDVLAGVTIATANVGTVVFESGGVRSFVLDALLVELEGRTDVAIEVLADPDAFERLFTWNEHNEIYRLIDQTVLETVLAEVLDEPFDDATTLDDVHLVIANVVGLADHEYFDGGFPPSLAATVTESIVPYLPYIIGSLDDLGGVHIKDFDGDRNVLIGSQAEITDLFGNLLRDPNTRDIVIATVTALTVSNDGSLYDDEALSEYVETLLDAAEGEQLEEQIQAERDRDGWNDVLDVVFGLIDRGLEAGGPKLAGAREQLHWFEQGARWVVDQIQAENIGLDDVPLAIRIVVSIGVALVFLRDFEPRTDEEEEQRDEAQRTLDEIRATADVGGDSRIDIDELLPRVLDLEDDIRKIDDDAFDAIHDPRLEPDNFVPERDAERTGD